ncbi:hypothetical protein [Haploplasma axanthum]|uniref:Uncharacterized protein n=1 Tax=Haploplasma axanthum TaxID=29552 RepID=A0A449BBG4_HAPAX|nr:hypothetical protein [Haploplasma axanthum]VEU79741.1 Uncharacterised protein [Haploplasma axanthum]
MNDLYEKYYKNGIIISTCLLFTPLILLISVLFGSSFELILIVIAIFFGTFALILVPTIIYKISKYMQYKKVVLTDIQVIRLEKVITGLARTFAFEVEMKIDNKVRKVSTKYIFSSSILSFFSLEDYSMKNAEVGYYQDTNEVVIIRLV